MTQLTNFSDLMMKYHLMNGDTPLEPPPRPGFDPDFDDLFEKIATESMLRDIPGLEIDENALINSKGYRQAKLEEVTQYWRDTLASRKNTEFYFLTVNPKPDVCLATLKEKTEKFFARSTTLAAIWTYEIRDSDVKNRGLHLHALMRKKTQTRPNNYRCSIRTHFKKLCGTVNHIKLLNVKQCDLKKVYNYILKQNSTKDDSDSNQATKTWRSENDLKHFYEKRSDESPLLVSDSKTST